MRDNLKGGALTETTFFILLSVFTPNHGYGIMQFIEKETKSRVVLGAGTLYGAINTSVKKNWITLYKEDLETRKKEYIITEEGKKVVENEIKRLNSVLNIGLNIFQGEGNEKKVF